MILIWGLIGLLTLTCGILSFKVARQEKQIFELQKAMVGYAMLIEQMLKTARDAQQSVVEAVKLIGENEQRLLNLMADFDSFRQSVVEFCAVTTDRLTKLKLPAPKKASAVSALPKFLGKKDDEGKPN